MHEKNTVKQRSLIIGIRENSRHPKWILSLILMFLYFFVWFSFGICYWYLPNRTNGEAFIFHSYQEIESRIAMFNKNMKSTYIPHDELNNIILNKQYHKNISRILVGEGSNKDMFLVSDTPIGEYWSRYYKEQLMKQGIAYFSTDFNLSRNFCDSFNVKHYPINIKFYKSRHVSSTSHINNIVQISSKTDLSKVKEVGEIYVIIGNSFYAELIKSYSEDLKNFNIINENLKSSQNNLTNLELVFNNSIVFLDDSIITLQKVINGEYAFPLIDFLYYSAITITTTGYGDILPNSTSVRWLVMVETLIGVIIAGAFVSSIFYRNSI